MSNVPKPVSLTREQRRQFILRDINRQIQMPRDQQLYWSQEQFSEVADQQNRRQRQELSAAEARVRGGSTERINMNIPGFQSGPLRTPYWDNPQRVARYHLALQSMEPNYAPPSWMNPSALEIGYNWIGTRPYNQGKEWWEWELRDTDPALPAYRSFINQMSTPPQEAVPNNERNLTSWNMLDQYGQANGMLPLTRSDIESLPREFQQAIFSQQGDWRTTYWMPAEIANSISGVLQNTPSGQAALASIEGETTSVTEGPEAHGGIPDAVWQNLPWYQQALIWAQNVQGGQTVQGAATGALQMSPFAIPAVIQGAATGGVGGAVVAGASTLALGAGLGAASSAPGIIGSIGQVIMKALNIPAETVERIPGFLAQILVSAIGDITNSEYARENYGSLTEVVQNLGAAWSAAGISYEVSPLGFGGNPFTNTMRAEILGQEGTQLVSQENYGLEAIAAMRRRIARGDRFQDIYDETIAPLGLGAMARDMLMQSAADPLNVAGFAITSAAEAAARATGRITLANALRSTRVVNTTGSFWRGLEEAAREVNAQWISPEASVAGEPVRLGTRIRAAATAMHETPGPIEGFRQYVRLLGMNEESLNTELSHMQRVERWIVEQATGFRYDPNNPNAVRVSLTEAGRDAITNKPGLRRVIPWLFGQTAESHASGLLVEMWDNMRHLWASQDVTPETMNSDVSRLSRGNAEGVGDISAGTWDKTKLASTFPIMLNDVQPQVKEFYDVNWTLPTSDRTIVQNIADHISTALYAEDVNNKPVTPYEVLNRLTGDDARAALNEYADVLSRSKDQNDVRMADMLRKLDPAELKKRLAKFNQGTPLTADQYKVKMIGMLGKNIEDWVTRWFRIKPEGMYFRIMDTVKAAQSMLLLNQPLYPLNNIMSNLSGMAFSGCLGLRSQDERMRFLRAFGYLPERLEQGMGMAEIGMPNEVMTPEARAVSGYTAGEVMRKAQASNDNLTKVQQFLRRTSHSKLGAFINLSQAVERKCSEIAYVEGIARYMNTVMRHGKGYSDLPADLVRSLSEVGIGEEVIYSAIDGSLSKQEIESKLWNGVARVSLDRLTEEQRQALQDYGVYDILSNELAHAQTKNDINRAFDNAEQGINERHEANVLQDLQTEWTEKTQAEIGTEGVSAVWKKYDEVTDARDVFQRAHDDHMTEIADKARNMPAEEARAYREEEFRKAENAWRGHWLQEEAALNGIFKGLGIDSDLVEPVAGDMAGKLGILHTNWSHFFDTRRELWSTYIAAFKDQSAFNQLLKRIGDILGPEEIENIVGAEEVTPLVRRAVSEAYIEAVQVEDGIQAEMDIIFADAVSKRFPASIEAAMAWRDSARAGRRLSTAAQTYFRMGVDMFDDSPEAKLVKQQIDQILGGSTLDDLTEGQRIEAWKKFQDLHKALSTEWKVRNETERLRFYDQASSLSDEGAVSPVIPDPELSEVERLRFEVRHDALTGLPNEKAFNEVVSENPDATIMAMDLRGLHLTNKTSGMNVGDAYIQSIGRLADEMGIEIYRLHGDEFAAIFPNASIGKQLMDQFMNRIENTIIYVDGVEYEGAKAHYGLGDSYGEADAAQNAARSADPLAKIYERSDYSLRARLGPETGGPNGEKRRASDSIAPGVEQGAPIEGGTAANPPAETTTREPELRPEQAAAIGRVEERAGTTTAGVEQEIREIPAFLTNNMRSRLRDMGYTADDIRTISPEQAWDIIRKSDRDNFVVDNPDALSTTLKNNNEVIVTDTGRVILPEEVAENSITSPEKMRSTLRKMAAEYGVYSDNHLVNIVRKAYPDLPKPSKETPARNILDQVTPDMMKNSLLLHLGRHDTRFTMTEGQPLHTAAMEDLSAARVMQRDIQRKQNQISLMSQGSFGRYQRDAFADDIVNVFGYTREEAAQYMAVADGLAKYYGRRTGDVWSNWYEKYLAGLIKGGELSDSLKQIAPVNRSMTDEEIRNYAGALVRAGEDEVRHAIAYEDNRQERIRIIDAVHSLDPNLAERVYINNKILFQQQLGAYGGATAWLNDGRAVIHAYEAKDLSTLAHELGHVWMRSLDGWANDDISTITGWLRTEHGMDLPDNWINDISTYEQAHEIFARALERYLADGTPPKNASEAIVRAFQSFKQWLVSIYRSITGSAIDVNISQEMRALFDKWFSEAPEERLSTPFDQLPPAGPFAYSASGRRMSVPKEFGDTAWLIDQARRETNISARQGVTPEYAEQLQFIDSLNPAKLSFQDVERLKDIVFGPVEGVNNVEVEVKKNWPVEILHGTAQAETPRETRTRTVRQTGFFDKTNEDLSIFSGTPAVATDQVFRPKEVVPQPSLPGIETRPQMKGAAQMGGPGITPLFGGEKTGYSVDVETIGNRVYYFTRDGSLYSAQAGSKPDPMGLPDNSVLIAPPRKAVEWLNGIRARRVEIEANTQKAYNAREVQNAQTERPTTANAAAGETGPNRGTANRGGAGRTNRTGGGRLVVARAERTASADPALVRQDLHQFLEQHQIEGAALALNALKNEGGFILADGTGAGKTREELAVADTLLHQGHNVLIVTASEVIKPNWKKMAISGSFLNDSNAMGMDIRLATDAAELRNNILITTYDRLGGFINDIDNNTYVIYDEAHKMKNVGSQRSDIGDMISRKAAGVLYATATPADKPTHLHYLFRAGVFGAKPEAEVYASLGLIERYITKGRHQEKVWVIDPYIGSAEVYRRMNELFGSLTERGLMVKREISMDGIEVQFNRLTMSDEAHALMDRIRSMQETRGPAKGLLAAKILMDQRRQQEPYKIPMVRDLVSRELADGRQVVVFLSRINESAVNVKTKDILGDTYYQEIARSEGTAKTLMRELNNAGINRNQIVELHGNAELDAPTAMSRFQNGTARVVIATLESGGTGINLDDVTGNAPRTLIMMTAPFSAVDNIQGVGRVWRLKSQSKPRIIYLFGDTEVDGWNSSIIAAKMEMLGATVAGEVNRLNVPAIMDMSDADKSISDAGSILYQRMNDPRLTYADSEVSNNEYQFRYRVVSLEDLITSHTNAGETNPAFPEELQPRMRDRAASEIQVQNIVRNFNPRKLLDEYHSLGKGAPIIGAGNMVVESGNGRTMGMRRLVLDRPEAYREYVDMLRGRLDMYGLSEADLEGIEHPILVRERITETDPIKFVNEANTSPGLDMSRLELAVNDAKNITPEMLTMLHFDGEDSISDQLISRENLAFVQRFTEGLSPNRLSSMMDNRSNLSRQGAEQIEYALAARIYNSEAGMQILTSFIDTADPIMSNLENAIYGALTKTIEAETLIAAGRRSTDFRIVDDLLQVLNVYKRLKAEGKMTPAEYVKQLPLFGAELDDFQRQLLLFIGVNGHKKAIMRRTFIKYFEGVIAQAEPGQINLFGAPTKAEIFAGAAREAAHYEGDFTVRTPEQRLQVETEIEPQENQVVQPTRDLPPVVPEAQQEPETIPATNTNPFVNMPPSTVDKMQGFPAASAEREAWVTGGRTLLSDIRKTALDGNLQVDNTAFGEQVRNRLRAQNPQWTEDAVNSNAVEIERRMKTYLNSVYQQQGDVKYAANRYGQSLRDEALYNYTRRTNFDHLIGSVLPYSFWFTRTGINWALRALDKPGLMAFYSRLKRYQDRVTNQDGYPTRLRGKFFVRLPFLPDWMGGGMYIDPMRQIFPFEQVLQPFETLATQNSMVNQRAQSLLQQWVEGGEADQTAALQAIQTRSGDLWNRALEQARTDTNADIQNPLDFISLISGPSLPIQWAYKALSGRSDEISQLPVTRMVQALTGGLGIGGPRGVNLEAGIRNALGMPGVDRYEDYRVDRMLSSMAADGVITPEQATRAMIERSGDVFEQAQRRVSQVGLARYLGAPLAVDFFPEGEQTQRQLRELYNQARDEWLNGDDDALNQFFADHPEYEAQRAAWRDPTERLRYFLRSEVWQRYTALGDLHRQQVREQLGSVFQDAFLNPETRSYDSISTETLAMWAQVMGADLPAGTTAPQYSLTLADNETSNAVQAYNDYVDQNYPNIYTTQNQYYGLQGAAYTNFGNQHPEIASFYNWRNHYLAEHPEIIPYVVSESSDMGQLPISVQQVIYQFRADREDDFPGILDLQEEYYNLTTNAERKDFKNTHPELVDYWNWRRRTAATNPTAAPYIMGEDSLATSIIGYENMPDEDVSAIISQFSPELTRQLLSYFYANAPLGSGGRTELQRVWRDNGQPGGTMTDFLEILREGFGG